MEFTSEPMKDKPRTKFTHLAQSTTEDWRQIRESYEPIIQSLPDRLMDTLRSLATIQGALPVSRLDHSLQAATRAARDGRPDEYVFMVLMHDIGAHLTHSNHAEVSSAIIRPYVSADLSWIVLHHDIFQGVHYFSRIGRNPNQRDEFIGHPLFEATAEFCALYDAPSWDPTYKSMPLDDFDPLMRAFLKPKELY